MSFVEKFRPDIPLGTEITVVKERSPYPSITLSATKKVEGKEPFSLKIKKGELEIRDGKTREKEKPKFDTTIAIETDQTRYKDPQYLEFVKSVLPVAIYDFGIEEYGFRVDNPFLPFEENKDYEQRKKEEEEKTERRNQRWREQVESGEKALIAVRSYKAIAQDLGAKLGKNYWLDGAENNLNFINNIFGKNREIHDFLFKTALPVVLAGDIQGGIRIEPCYKLNCDQDDDSEYGSSDRYEEYPLRVVAGNADHVFQGWALSERNMIDALSGRSSFSWGGLKDCIDQFGELSLSEIVGKMEIVISNETERIRQAGEPHVVKIERYWERNTESEVFGTKK